MNVGPEENLHKSLARFVYGVDVVLGPDFGHAKLDSAPGNEFRGSSATLAGELVRLGRLAKTYVQRTATSPVF